MPVLERLLLMVGALKWKYHEALFSLDNEEVRNLSIDELNKLEENAME